MVGGIIINVVALPTCIWVQCRGEGCEQNDALAIRVKYDANSTQMKPGDSLWWQSRCAFWTPSPRDGRQDVKLNRIGYSHHSIPDDVMATIEPDEEQ